MTRRVNLNGVYYNITGDITRKTVSPWKAKIISRGSKEYDDFSQAEMEEYHDFRNGIGLESGLPDEDARLWWSEGVDVSTARSAVLGPLVTTAGSFGVAPVKILDFESVTYAIADNAFGRWNTSTSVWDFADPFLIHDCEAAWDELVDADATVTLDTTVEKQGSGCAKMVVGAGLGNGDIIATDDITLLDLSGAEKVRLWVQCTEDRAAGDLQLLLDNTANCASPKETIDIPVLTANTWTQVTLTLANPSTDTAIISVGLKFTANVEACTVYLDHIMGTFPDAIDAVVATDATDSYLVVSSATAATYTTDGITWATLTGASGGYMAPFSGRLWFISTDGVTVTYSGYNDIDSFDSNPTWTTPTGYHDPDDVWDNPTNAYDDNITTDADTDDVPATSWSSYLELTFTESFYDRVRVLEGDGWARQFTTVDVDVYYDSAWYNLWEGGYEDEVWGTFKLSSTQKISKARVRFYNKSAGVATPLFSEFDVGIGGDSFTLVGDFGTVYGLFEGKLLTDGSPALYFHGTAGLYTIDISAERAYQQEVEYPPLTYAGHAGMYWNANVWVATGYGILKVAPSLATYVGPDQDDGLPSGYQGYIYDITSVNNWLVFCVNGGTTDKSSILKRNSSLGGNIQVYTTAATSKQIACIHHSPSSLYTNGRLWFGESTDIKYMMWPDITSNVKQIATYEYVDDSGYCELPILRKLAAINKVALGVSAITKSCDANEYVQVFYGLNGAAPTTSLGTFKTSPRPTILTFGSDLGTEFYRIQLAFKLFRGSTSTNSPELESLLFYWLGKPTRIMSWTFNWDLTGENSDALFTALEALFDTDTLIPFYPSGDIAKTLYNVAVVAMPDRSYYEEAKQKQGMVQITVSEIFKV